MIKILDIGNSFGEDATYFLHSIAKGAGIETKVVNLYIGGCPLEKHWLNIESGAKAYEYQINGKKTARYVSVEEVLMEDEWDYIVTQQASHDSGWAESYEPFLSLMAAYLKEKAPRAELLLQQTWAYEKDSAHWGFMRYHRDQNEMAEKSRAAYRLAAARNGLRLIPCGELVQLMREKEPFKSGDLSICRDGFHMSFLYGRYLLASVWAKVILGVSMQENTYVPAVDFLPFEKPNHEIVAMIQNTVDEFLAK